MKKSAPAISSFKSDSQGTIRIRTTLFDLFSALNEEVRAEEEDLVSKIVIYWIESGRLKLVLR